MLPSRSAESKFTSFSKWTRGAGTLGLLNRTRVLRALHSCDSRRRALRKKMILDGTTARVDSRWTEILERIKS